MDRMTLVSLGVLAVLFLARPCRSDEITETWPDGTKKAVYGVNADGVKQGNYVEFHPGGRRKTQGTYRRGKRHGPWKSFFADGRVKTVATYRDGKLHGPRQQFDRDTSVADEVWLDGKLIIPKSAARIAAELAAIRRATIETVGELPPTTADIRQAVADRGLAAKRKAALKALMAYRYLCDVPYKDLVLDRAQVAHTEAACRLLARIGRLEHTPPNPGMPEEEYRFAYEGASHSNIFVATRARSSMMVDAVTYFMNDSDRVNIDCVGHRRWCLNPAMRKTGFAAWGNYAAMWSSDKSRADVPDYDYVAFPPRGLTPTACFQPNYAWSVSLNPDKYERPDPAGVKVRVFSVRAPPRRGDIEKSSQPLPLNYFKVSRRRIGIPNCIIFRPAGVKVAANAAYWVEISGIRRATGKDTTIEYLVAFFKL